jgi:hypothetical protein
MQRIANALNVSKAELFPFETIKSAKLRRSETAREPAQLHQS